MIIIENPRHKLSEITVRIIAILHAFLDFRKSSLNISQMVRFTKIIILLAKS